MLLKCRAIDAKGEPGCGRHERGRSSRLALLLLRCRHSKSLALPKLVSHFEHRLLLFRAAARPPEAAVLRCTTPSQMIKSVSLLLLLPYLTRVSPARKGRGTLHSAMPVASSAKKCPFSTSRRFLCTHRCVSRDNMHRKVSASQSYSFTSSSPSTVQDRSVEYRRASAK